jgi:ribosomal protein S18 acetylase RimI-like enzyme
MLVFKRVETHADAESLRLIRNQCRDFMTRTTDYITKEQQEKWFVNAKDKYSLYLAYGIEHGVIVTEAGYGLIHNNTTESLLTGGLLPDYRNRGLGLELFGFLVAECRSDLPVRLEVLKTNLRAIKTYNRLNFVIAGENERVYFMELEKKNDSAI